MSEERLSSERLRAALLRGEITLAGDDDPCPPAERLVLSARGELPPAEDEPVLLHLARCTACGAAWRISREVGRGSAPAPRRAPRTLYRKARGPLAAVAALLLAAAGLSTLWLAPSGLPAPVYREQPGAALRSRISEEAPLSRDQFLLRWSAGPEGTTYDVIVMSGEMEPLARGRGLGQPEYRVPPEALSGLDPGARVFWQVVGYLPDGRRIASPTFIARVE